MKKIAVLLSVVLVLSLGSAALAADVKVGGEVKYTIEMVGSSNTYKTDWKLNASGSVSDQLGFVVGLKTGAALDKANFTLKNFGAPFTVTVGKGSVVTGRLNALEAGPTNFYGFEGINIKTTDLSGFTGQLLLNPANKDAMVKVVMVDYKAPFGEFGFNYQPAQSSSDKADMAVEAKVPVPSTPVTGYLQYTKIDDGEGFIMAGAQAEFSGITVYAETNLQKDELLAADDTKTAFGVSGALFGGEWSVDVASPKSGDSTTTLAFKVAF